MRNSHLTSCLVGKWKRRVVGRGEDLLFIRALKSILLYIWQKNLPTDFISSFYALTAFGFRDSQAVMWPNPPPTPPFDPLRDPAATSGGDCSAEVKLHVDGKQQQQQQQRRTQQVQATSKLSRELTEKLRLAIKADDRRETQGRNLGKGIRLLKCERFLFNLQEFEALKAQRRYDFILSLPAL